MTAPLFDVAPALPEGMRYTPDLITAAAERALARRFAELPFRAFEFQGFLGKRRVVSFGWRYDFNLMKVEATENIPAFLLPLRERAAAFAGLEPAALQQVLLTEYGPGAGIGWHKDRSVFERVVGVSLNSPADLRFRQRTDSGFRRFSLAVEPRSAYLLSGEARHAWEHSIVPGEALRFSITFRTLSDLGRRKAAEAQRSS
jgi:alkylated DNA repair dioxygenase AlkB